MRDLLSDGRQIGDELFFLDDHIVLGAELEQPEVPEPLHENASAGPGRAHHSRQLFV